jgi:hypothetical protein
MKNLKLLLVAFCCITFGLSVFAQPENLYIIGGPFNANKPNWLFRDIVQMDKDSANPAIFYYRGYIGYNTFGDEPGNFKILTANNSWDGYHPDGNSNQPLGAEQVGKTLSMRLGGDDTKWYISDDRSGDGYYEIKVDTENNTFLIESFTPDSSPEFPVGLFCVGGPFIINDGGWNPSEAKKMERDGKNPNVFHFSGYLEYNQWGNEPGNFKILINARTWDDSFHPGADSDVLLSDAIGKPLPVRNGGADNKWNLPENGDGNGYWKFTIDAQNLTVKVDTFIRDIDYFDHVYISGDAMPCGWTNSTPEIMNKVAEGVYSWTGIVNAGEFKFLKYINSWSACYVAESENEPVVLNNGQSFVYEKDYTKLGNDYKFGISQDDANKEVTVILNMNEKIMKVITTTNAIDHVKNLSVAVSAAKGKALINGETSKNYTARIFSIDGKQIVQKTFTGNTEITLQQGYYLISVSDISGIITSKKIVII